MISLILSGAKGRMGQVLARMIAEQDDLQVAFGLDVAKDLSGGFPIYGSLEKASEAGQVLIDFSHPAALSGILSFCRANRLPAVLCATGYRAADMDLIEAAAKEIPVFRSGNMSLGINVAMDLVRRAAAVLGEQFDIEIVERHHRNKVDAPSGTALMLADAAAQGLPRESEYIYERESRRMPREAQEIGISAVRGGTIVGEHTVIFAGHDEVIEITHRAYSREIFASGALKAARFLLGQQPGLYDMNHVLQAQ